MEGHETHRFCSPTTEATALGDRPLETGAFAGRGGTPPRRNRRCSLPVEKGLPDRRPRSPAGQTPERSTTQVNPPTVRRTAATAEAGGTAPRLGHGPLDLAANCGPDSTLFRHRLRPVRGVVSAATAGLELPEAAPPLPAARSGSRSPLASARLAADKKKRAVTAEPSSFSTKRAFCCSLWSAAPGPHAARRRSCSAGTGTSGSRSSPPSVVLRSAVGWGCGSRFASTTLPPRTV